MMTVLEVLQTTAVYFAKKGVENPRLNIEHLLAETLSKKRLDLYLEFDRELSDEELGVVREKVRRRGQREPLQHLIGHWDFFGRTFKIDKRALVPRPETELLVEAILLHCGNAPLKIVDVGTGSGILAITLALEHPEFEVWAVDISEEALSLSRENANRLQAEKRVHFAYSDLLRNLDGPFDWIVANLPYLKAEDLVRLQPEVQFDPPIALDGGIDGLEIIERLVKSAPQKLVPGGAIALEFGVGQAERLALILRQQNYRDILVKKDYQGHERVLMARYG
ncbi:MAG: peptide chain release factor N(5)-glutamine methyltransferase [Verrucomicrobia bacterium]|nr:peptide chain release factor N(5)-glutamine methyltransferase [Verrucomicrobiota bacterium]MBV9672058.1 peptide chain release factor N(5)-glutamine methyltransferase [Verrucomicrobiota bacterium]